MSSFSKPTPSSSSSRKLGKVAFFSREERLGLVDGLGVGRVVERERDDRRPLAAYLLVHLDEVREVLLAGSAPGRPGVDEGVLDVGGLGRGDPGQEGVVLERLRASPRRALAESAARGRSGGRARRGRAPAARGASQAKRAVLVAVIRSSSSRPCGSQGGIGASRQLRDRSGAWSPGNDADRRRRDGSGAVGIRQPQPSERQRAAGVVTDG